MWLHIRQRSHETVMELRDSSHLVMVQPSHSHSRIHLSRVCEGAGTVLNYVQYTILGNERLCYWFIYLLYYTFSITVGCTLSTYKTLFAANSIPCYTGSGLTHLVFAMSLGCIISSDLISCCFVQ